MKEPKKNIYHMNNFLLTINKMRCSILPTFFSHIEIKLRIEGIFQIIKKHKFVFLLTTCKKN